LLETDHVFLDLIEQGVRDGSVRTIEDIALVEASIAQSLWSFGQRIANRGKAIETEINYSGIELIKQQVELFIMALKN